MIKKFQIWGLYIDFISSLGIFTCSFQKIIHLIMNQLILLNISKTFNVKHSFISLFIKFICIQIIHFKPFLHVLPFHPGSHPNSHSPFNLLQFGPHLFAQFGPYQPGRHAVNDKLLTMKYRFGFLSLGRYFYLVQVSIMCKYIKLKVLYMFCLCIF